MATNVVSCEAVFGVSNYTSNMNKILQKMSM